GRRKRASSFSSDSTCSCERCLAKETVTCPRRVEGYRDLPPVNIGSPIQTRLKANPQIHNLIRRESDFLATEGCSSSESRPDGPNRYSQNFYRNVTPMPYGRGVSTAVRPYGRNGYI
ncbi:unnamed protein product, partial [Hymenolepis diminuta]